jgi:hypothetical protein
LELSAAFKPRSIQTAGPTTEEIEGVGYEKMARLGAYTTDDANRPGSFFFSSSTFHHQYFPGTVLINDMTWYGLAGICHVDTIPVDSMNGLLTKMLRAAVVLKVSSIP